MRTNDERLRREQGQGPPRREATVQIKRSDAARPKAEREGQE